ncbi:hypothetical protein QHF83_52710, partial [Polyangium sp. 15x6]
MIDRYPRGYRRRISGRPASRVEPRRPGEEHKHELAAVLAALAALAGVMVEPSEAEDQGASMGSARGRPRASSR